MFRIKIRIAKLHRTQSERGISERIQVGYARTAYAHVVAERQILRCAQRVAQQQRRHHIGEIDRIIRFPEIVELHILGSIFIAHSRLKSEFLISQVILAIYAEHMLAVTVVARALYLLKRPCIIGRVAALLQIAAVIDAVNVFRAEIERMDILERQRIICLESIFQSFAPAVLVAHELFIVACFVYVHIQVHFCGAGIEPVREYECLGLVARRCVLIVHRQVSTLKLVIIVAHQVIVICLAAVTHHSPTPVDIIRILVYCIKRTRQGYEIERIKFVARIDGRILERTRHIHVVIRILERSHRRIFSIIHIYIARKRERFYPVVAVIARYGELAHLRDAIERTSIAAYG